MHVNSRTKTTKGTDVARSVSVELGQEAIKSLRESDVLKIILVQVRKSNTHHDDIQEGACTGRAGSAPKSRRRYTSL